ncbi:transporter substrate-binding domain-containing protein [Streptococcus dentiloxodontae]
MKKKTLFGLIVLVALVIVAYFGYQSVSGNKASQSGSSDKKVLRVATTGVSFPGSYKDDNGNLTGFDVEVAKAVADKIGYDIEFTTTSFDGLFGLLTSGKADAVASSIAITDERKQSYDFSSPYATFKYGVVVQSSSDLTNINELSGKTLAATVGSNQINVINNYDPSITIQTFDDREAALTGVVNGQVDGYSNAKTILAAIIKQKNLDLKILDGELGEENIAIAFNKGQNEDLRKKVDKALAELQADGTIKKLSEKFFSGIDASYKK